MEKIETLGLPQKIEVTAERGLIITMDDEKGITSVVTINDGGEKSAMALYTEAIRRGLNAVYGIGGPVAAKIALRAAKQLHRADIKQEKKP